MNDDKVIHDDVIEDNVIHVSFGPGGGRRSDAPEMPEQAAPHKASESVPPPPHGRSAHAEPYGELFRREEVARLFEIPEGRLRYWARSKFVEPSGKVGRRRYYTFQDLIAIRTAKELLDRGLALTAVRRSLEALGQTLPAVTRPLNELRITAEGQSVVVRDHSHAFEPETGQLTMDFEVQTLRDDVVRVLRPERVDPERRRMAYEKYLEGCRLDEAEHTFDKAEACYREAITLDPMLANALTNWGNLRYRRGDLEEAERLYRRALEVDTEQPEALYNLGFLAFERGEMAEACERFAQAVEHDPGFADAHFNLAMALESLGDGAAAKPHWKTYLELDPDGPWAEIAEKHLRGDWR